MGTRVLQDMFGDEPGGLLKRSEAIAVLPLGSTEYHGPRGPFGTDLDVASEVSRRVATEMDAVLLPAVPLGHSPDHQTWPGTIHLSYDTLRDLIVDVAISVHRHGVTHLVLLLGHWGDYEPALEAIQLCAQRGLDLRVEAIRVFDESILDMHRLEDVFGGAQWHGHGGAAEVSVSLHARPQLNPPSPEEVASTSPPVAERSYSRLGWQGIPEEASPERGASTADIAAQAIVAYLRQRLR